MSQRLVDLPLDQVDAEIQRYNADGLTRGFWLARYVSAPDEAYAPLAGRWVTRRRDAAAWWPSREACQRWCDEHEVPRFGGGRTWCPVERTPLLVLEPTAYDQGEG